jgi:small subunit ribosomal protein S14
MAKTSQINRANAPAKFSSRKMNRCRLCGRPRAYIRFFGLCRICMRRLALKGELPGVTKANN